MILAVCPNPAIDVLLNLKALNIGQVNRVESEMKCPGGKGVHVAMALRELGEEVTLLGFWGGPSGIWILERCRALRIHCVGPQLHEWTRTCLTIHHEGQETEVLEPGPRIGPDVEREFLDTLQQEAERASLVTISGSLPNGLEPGFYQRMVEASSGVPVLVDCAGDNLRAALRAKPLGFHINRPEAEAMGEKDMIQAARRFGVESKLAAITDGARGLYLGTPGGVWHGQVEISKVATSTVGSGDCLLAGLAFAQRQRLSAEDVTRWGVACGAANCLRPELGMLYRRDAESLLSKVRVKKL